MGVDHDIPFHGKDGSDEILSQSMVTNDHEKMIFMTSASKKMWWASAMTSKYKLVLSENDVPWFFDRVQDPDELVNYNGQSSTKAIEDDMQKNLLSIITDYDFPLQDHPFLLESPACIDSPNSFFRNGDSMRWDCTLAPFNPVKREQWCQDENTVIACPVTCSKCMKDSTGSLWIDSRERSCEYVKKNLSVCSSFAAHHFCLSTCHNSTNIF